jgi:signal transduction histidine kinase
VSAGRVDGDHAGPRRLLRNLSGNGPGIPGADRARVLERFVRLDDARARDSGGSVAVAASPLGGARVEVRLPRLADPGD